MLFIVALVIFIVCMLAALGFGFAYRDPARPYGMGQPLALWVADKPITDRVILIAGTGNHLPEKRSYIGSVQDGSFVWHVYEGTE